MGDFGQYFDVIGLKSYTAYGLGPIFFKVIQSRVRRTIFDQFSVM